MPENTSALAGIRVLNDFKIIPGLSCNQLLCDYGTDIIEVEKPRSGIDTRHWEPPSDSFRGENVMTINRIFIWLMQLN